jgi:hypothetical protein
LNISPWVPFTDKTVDPGLYKLVDPVTVSELEILADPLKEPLSDPVKLLIVASTVFPKPSWITPPSTWSTL